MLFDKVHEDFIVKNGVSQVHEVDPVIHWKIQTCSTRKYASLNACRWHICSLKILKHNILSEFKAGSQKL